MIGRVGRAVRGVWGVVLVAACQGGGGDGGEGSTGGGGTTGGTASGVTSTASETTGAVVTGGGATEGSEETTGAPTTGGAPTSDGGSEATGTSGAGETTGGLELGASLLKINVGGPAVGEFRADDGAEAAYRASPDSVVYAVADAVPDGSVPAEVPLEVFASGRVEPDELSGGTGQLRWSVPVVPGAYQVRLHFAGPSAGAGSRVLDVRVDDTVVVPGLDVSALTDGGAAATVTFAAEADAWLDLELVRAPGSAMPLLAAIELFGDGALRDGPAGVVRHVTATGVGDGSSLDAAAGLAALPGLIAASGPGDEVWIHAGDYDVAAPLTIAAGGAPGDPVVVRGVGVDWHDDGRPLLRGDRASPWAPDGEIGGEVFRLGTGADHLRFVNLGFVDQGNGCWRIIQPIAGLELDNIVATNVHRLLEDYVSGDGAAGVTGLRVKDVSVRGYARAVARLQYDTSAVLLEDVFGDSEAQQFASFSTGVVFDGTAHDAVMRRAVMLNHRQLDVEGYWNADGFSSERDNHGLVYEDTFAAGNTDGGYDLKSTATTLTRATAVDNKRNFRLWGEIAGDGCVGRDPFKRGGSGTQAQVHVNPQASVTLSGCRFVDASPSTVVFDADDDGVATVTGGCVTRDPASTYQSVEPTASLTLVDVADGCP